MKTVRAFLDPAPFNMIINAQCSELTKVALELLAVAVHTNFRSVSILL